MVNKKGVARIIELLISIILISAVLIIVYRQNLPSQESQDLSELARDILSEIASNDILRDEVILEQTQVSDMISTLAFINDSLPDYIVYELKSCDISSACGQSSYVGDVFSAERIISASRTNFNPIKLRLFLWVEQ